MRRGLALLSMLLMAGLSACGGGGGGGSNPSPYTGLTTPAVITASNADNIARQAFVGGDLGANVMLSPVLSGAARASAGKPMALTLVQLLSGAATDALLAPSSVRAPAPRAVVPYDNVIDDGWGEGGQARYTLSVDNVTGAFTGTFVFDNFHGDAGGVINGTIAVRGVVYGDGYGGGYIEIHFNFQSVTVMDGAASATAQGTVDLTASLDFTLGTGGGTAILNLYFTDNGTGKCAWLSEYTVNVTDLGYATQVATFGRIYLPEYGYVDVFTEMPFLYPALDTQPTGGVITLIGKPAGSYFCQAKLTVQDASTYLLEVDADGNNSYEWSVTHTW